MPMLKQSVVVNPLVLAILGAVARWGLTILGTSLAEHGGLAPDQLERLLSTETQAKVVGGLVVVLPLVWSVVQKHGGIANIQAALHLRPGATMAEIKVRAAQPDIVAVELKAGQPVVPPPDPPAEVSDLRRIIPRSPTPPPPVNVADVLSDIVTRLITIEQQGDMLMNKADALNDKFDQLSAAPSRDLAAKT